MNANNEKTWRELFPYGRTICYDGDAVWRIRPRDQTGIRLRSVCRSGVAGAWQNGGPQYGEDDWGRTHWFHCPPEHLDAIYASHRWPMGS